MIFSIILRIIFSSLNLIFSKPVSFKFSGEVVEVSDGDTIKVKRNGQIKKLRLANIDCPELYQAFGKEAKRLTTELVNGKDVLVKVAYVDRYDRYVSYVIFDKDRSLNHELVKAGLAWEYKHHSKGKDKLLTRYENEARKAKKGLWIDDNPTSPREYRNNNK